MVPWKRGLGYATRALALLLPDTAKGGLDYVELTTDLSNAASQAVIRANGGELVEQFKKADMYGRCDGSAIPHSLASRRERSEP